MVSASEPSLPTSAFELCSAFEVPTPPEMLSLSSLTSCNSSRTFLNKKENNYKKN
jgi:hypothetical protein